MGRVLWCAGLLGLLAAAPAAASGGLRGVPVPEVPASASAEPRQLLLPPWWILNGIKPDGPPQDMGGWTAVTFSQAQQKQFGVSASGQVEDRPRFEAALAKLRRDRGGEPEDAPSHSAPQQDQLQRNVNLEWA
eukprot:SRR837773.4752.p3 GENE.SRR837773.4752~~SRR837773.4752.p3  ORF type:complete len:133 (+),score=25.05 SRR837773.4752:45-443(+)